MEKIDIFGKRLKIVEDDGVNCDKCVLKPFCYPRTYPMPCMDSYGNINRHFENA